MKEYGFCTDDHVGSNPGCERFDEGSTLLEVVQNHIKDYEEGYKTRNFRHGRVNMSLYEEHIYASRIRGLFYNLRMNAERYELIKNRFGLTDDHAAWTSEAWLKDLKEAAELGQEFNAGAKSTSISSSQWSLRSRESETNMASLR